MAGSLTQHPAEDPDPRGSDLFFVRAPMPLVEKGPTPPVGFDQVVLPTQSRQFLVRAAFLGAAVAAVAIGFIENANRFSNPADIAKVVAAPSQPVPSDNLSAANTAARGDRLSGAITEN